MKSWHILDFPNKIYLSLRDDFREEFFNEMFKKFGGKRPYARFLNISQKTIKQYYMGYTYKNKTTHPQAIPISLFKKSESFIDKELKRKIENNIFLLKGRGDSNPVINPKLPIQESPAFYRIVAHIIGDGSASKNHVPYYANTCKQLREQFRKDLEIFGELKTYERKTNTTSVIYFQKVITDILSHILKIKFSYPTHVPEDIFYASNECKSSFLRALFDDEGTISTNLAISMSNLNIIKQIKELTENIGIKTNTIIVKQYKNLRDNFYLSIKKTYFKEFKEKIGFVHPEKMRNLEFAIATMNREQRTRDSKEIEKQVIEHLKKNSTKTLDLANRLQFSLSYTLNLLKRMEKERKIKRSGFKNKIIWSLT